MSASHPTTLTMWSLYEGALANGYSISDQEHLGSWSLDAAVSAPGQPGSFPENEQVTGPRTVVCGDGVHWIVPVGTTSAAADAADSAPA
ncbi:MAG TPA: hypothetical protein VIK57_22025 [Streptosporangiaceae bacterium]